MILKLIFIANRPRCNFNSGEIKTTTNLEQHISFGFIYNVANLNHEERWQKKTTTLHRLFRSKFKV